MSGVRRVRVRAIARGLLVINLDARHPSFCCWLLFLPGVDYTQAYGKKTSHIPQLGYLQPAGASAKISGAGRRSLAPSRGRADPGRAGARQRAAGDAVGDED